MFSSRIRVPRPRQAWHRACRLVRTQLGPSCPAPDVVVVGAGFAGLSAAVRLARARRARAGRRRAPTARRPRHRVCGPADRRGRRQRPARAVRVLSRDVRLPARHRRRTATSRLEERLDIEIVDRARRASPPASTPLPPPLHLVGGLLRWPALGLADRVARPASGPGASAAGRVGSRPRWRDRQTVDRRGCVRMGRRRGCREVLWEPLAVAALNQSPARGGGRARSSSVLSRMFNGSASDAAIGLPVKPLDQLYAEPARRLARGCGHRVRVGAPRTAARRRRHARSASRSTASASWRAPSCRPCHGSRFRPSRRPFRHLPISRRHAGRDGAHRRS